MARRLAWPAGSSCASKRCAESAIFVALFSGQVGVNPHAFGTIAVAVTHAPLPDPEDPPAALTGGVWQLQALFARKV